MCPSLVGVARSSDVFDLYRSAADLDTNLVVGLLLNE